MHECRNSQIFKPDICNGNKNKLQVCRSTGSTLTNVSLKPNALYRFLWHLQTHAPQELDIPFTGEETDFLSHENDQEKKVFDLPSFINDLDVKPNIVTPPIQIKTEPERKRPIGGKKVDLEAQKYIIDDPDDVHIDVETISESGSPPALEAGDLDSLLEQFEASEVNRSALEPEVCGINVIDSDSVKVKVKKEIQVHVPPERKKTVKCAQEKYKNKAVVGK